MQSIKGNVCFFHREEDDKWLWFVCDSYGRALAKCVNPFDSCEEAQQHYKDNIEMYYERLNFEPFKSFFKKP